MRETLIVNVTTDSQSPESAETDKIKISLNPGPFYSANLTRVLTIPGAGAVDGLLSGEYTIVAWGTKGHRYVEDIEYGGRSILTEGFHVFSDSSQSSVNIRIASDGGIVRVQSTDANRSPIADSWISVTPAEAITVEDIAASWVVGRTDTFLVARRRGKDFDEDRALTPAQLAEYREQIAKLPDH
jgi:hypothetical protein